MSQIDMQNIGQKLKALWQQSQNALDSWLLKMSATPERSRRVMKWLLALLLLATILALTGCAGISTVARADCPPPVAPPSELMQPPRAIYLLKSDQIPLRLRQSAEKPSETPPPAR